MLLWLIIDKVSHYEVMKGMESVGEKDFDTHVVLASDISFSAGERNEILLFERGLKTSPPDVFLLWGHYSEIFEGISDRLTFLGARSVNDINGKRIVCSKLKTSLLLEKENLPQPKTMLVGRNTPASVVTDNLGLPVIFKPSGGSQGEGVVLIESESAVSDYLGKLPEDAADAVLAQKYMKASRGIDIRVLLIDYKVFYSIARVAGNPDEFRSNIHQGGHLEKHEIDDATKAMCEKAARACGLRYCGLDLLLADDGYVIGEINCTPGNAPELMTPDYYAAMNRMFLET